MKFFLLVVVLLITTSAIGSYYYYPSEKDIQVEECIISSKTALLRGDIHSKAPEETLRIIEDDCNEYFY